MEEKLIQESVVRIIADHLGLPAASLKLQDQLSNDLGADSFDHIELIITIEENFNIRIPQEKWKDLKMIVDMVTYIQEVMNKE